MRTDAQIVAARRNIRRAQVVWRSMSRGFRSRAQSEGRRRAKPGSTGRGAYFHVEVRPKTEFRSFRVQDVGRRGHSQRVAGRRVSGSWATQKWLISKQDAHVERNTLVGDSASARKILHQLGSPARRVQGDRFKAKDRPNVPERMKPTAAMQRARMRNIRKAQAARSKRGAQLW